MVDQVWSTALVCDHFGKSVGAWVTVHKVYGAFAAELHAFLLGFQVEDDL